ncbi:MAG: tetratricopeptide repeat protein [Bacteroidales bacterium]|jgi:tetratricopeptide (TPR) repeat protein
MLKLKTYIVIFLLTFVFIAANAQINQHSVDSMERKLRTANDTTKIIILNNLSILCFSSTAKSEYYANKALTLSRKIKNEKFEAYTLIYIGYINLFRSNYKKAIEYAETGLKISEKNNYKKCIAMATDYIGKAYYYLGDYNRALNYFQLSLAAYRKVENSKSDTVGIYLYLGYIFFDQKNYDKALSYFLNALKKEKENGSYYSRLNIKIGDIYNDWGRYKEALGYYKKIIEVSLKSGDKLIAAYNMNRAGEIYLKINEYKPANEYATKALKILSELRDSTGIQASMSILGNTYKKQKQYGKAFYYLKRAVEICQRTNYKQQVADNLFSIGELCFETKDYDNAIENFNSSLEMSKKLNSRKNIFKNYEALSKIYLAKGNYKEAYKYEQLYTSVKDSVFNENINKQITEIQTKFETEKKEKEILKLNKEKEIKEATISQHKQFRNYLIVCFVLLLLVLFIIYNRYRLKQKLRHEKQLVELEQKALRMQMNPHFIFNALNSISLFISNKDELSANDYLIRFAKLMRQTLENSGKPLITIRQEVEALKYYLDLEQLRFADKFDFNINIDSKIEQEAMLIPPLLLQPIVENAILHGIFPKKTKGKIDITLELNGNNKITCKIEDDGVGRNYKLKSNSYESIGMKVTAERLRIINHANKKEMQLHVFDIKDENNNPEGTRVEFNLPVLMT